MEIQRDATIKKLSAEGAQGMEVTNEVTGASAMRGK